MEIMKILQVAVLLVRISVLTAFTFNLIHCLLLPSAHAHWWIFNCITSMRRLWTRAMHLFTSKAWTYTTLCKQRINILWTNRWISRVSSFTDILWIIQGCGINYTSTRHAHSHKILIKSKFVFDLVPKVCCFGTQIHKLT